MRSIVLLTLISLVALMVACSESFTDSRDGQRYDIVQIGSQTWMAENLNYEVEGSVCPEGENRNCSRYGRLYTWDVARTICPEGLHLPDSADFEKLIANVGGAEVAGYALKSTSGWFKKGNGSDDFGFNALPAGYRLGSGKFDDIGGYAQSGAPSKHPKALLTTCSWISASRPPSSAPSAKTKRDRFDV